MKKLILLFLIFLFIVRISAQKKNVMVLGDSNGAFDSGWVYQLSRLHPEVNFINFSIAGNTIGFDNLNKDTLNTLKNINKYLKKALEVSGKIDIILIMLGTNDCKAIYDSLQPKVVKNLDSLINILVNYKYPVKKPDIVIITPPPAGHDSILQSKYYGILKRLKNLIPEYKKIALKYNVHFIDIFTPLEKDLYELTTDGIHFKTIGYIKIAEIIDNSLKKFRLIK